MRRDRLCYPHSRRQRLDRDWLAYVRVSDAMNNCITWDVSVLRSSYVHGFPQPLCQVVELNTLGRIAVKGVNVPGTATPNNR